MNEFIPEVEAVIAKQILRADGMHGKVVKNVYESGYGSRIYIIFTDDTFVVIESDIIDDDSSIEIMNAGYHSMTELHRAGLIDDKVESDQHKHSMIYREWQQAESIRKREMAELEQYNMLKKKYEPTSNADLPNS